MKKTIAMVLILVLGLTLVSAQEDGTYLFNVQKDGFGIWRITTVIKTPTIFPVSLIPSEYNAKIKDISGSEREISWAPAPLGIVETIDPNNPENSQATYFFPKNSLILSTSAPNDFFISVSSPTQRTRTVVDLQPFNSLLCGNGTCDKKYENHVSCPADCASGALDSFCSQTADGVCDRDCFSSFAFPGEYSSLDPDCVIPNLGECKEHYRYCWQNSIFTCALDKDSNPTWIWRENCETTCNQNGFYAQCSGTRSIQVVPPCKNNSECVNQTTHGEEQWYCNCGACQKEPIKACCFRP